MWPAHTAHTKSPQAGQLTGVDRHRHSYGYNDAVTFVRQRNTNTRTHTHTQINQIVQRVSQCGRQTRLRHNWANFLLTLNCRAYEISRFERRNKQWQHNRTDMQTNGLWMSVEWMVAQSAEKKHANGKRCGRCNAQYSSAALVARIKCVANRYLVPPKNPKCQQHEQSAEFSKNYVNVACCMQHLVSAVWVCAHVRVCSRPNQAAKSVRRSPNCIGICWLPAVCKQVNIQMHTNLQICRLNACNA